MVQWSKELNQFPLFWFEHFSDTAVFDGLAILVVAMNMFLPFHLCPGLNVWMAGVCVCVCVWNSAKSFVMWFSWILMRFRWKVFYAKLPYPFWWMCGCKLDLCETFFSSLSNSTAKERKESEKGFLTKKWKEGRDIWKRAVNIQHNS